MKTIAQFAKEHNISAQTVYRKLGKGVKQDGQQGLTEKHANITYLTEKGEDFLCSCLTPLNGRLADVKQPLNAGQQAKSADNEEILFLRKQNESLQTELTLEREHSRAITDRLAQITENQQKLLGMEQSRTNPALLGGKDKPHGSGKKRGILGLFKRK